MVSCWQENEENRPTFLKIVEELEKLLEMTSDYLDLSSYNTEGDNITSSEGVIGSSPGNDAVSTFNPMERVLASPNDYTIPGFIPGVVVSSPYDYTPAEL